MDGPRFDAVTRRIATGTSRRQALRLGGGGLAAALLTLAGLRDVAADNPKPLRMKCRKDAQCASGFCDPDTRTCAATTPPSAIVTGELTAADPVFSGCAEGFPYDAYTFPHPGGPLSLSERGSREPGDVTIEDPYIALFTGGVPSDWCESIAFDDDSGCGHDAYLETTQPAGTYTAVVIEYNNWPGTCTLERNTFSGGAC